MMETIGTEVYKDGYGERVGLKYRYDPETNQNAQGYARLPQVQVGRREEVWSIQSYKDVVIQACDLLDSMGKYDTTVIRTYAGAFSENQRNSSDCWTITKRTRLYLHWPYIADPALRDRVRLAVRSISGRKYHADQKCWSIPTSQAITLYTILEDVYSPLAEAIKQDEGVQQKR